MKKTKTDSVIKLKPYEIIVDAVEGGLYRGIHKAYKHTDDPTKDDMIASCRDAVMLALCEVIDFD